MNALHKLLPLPRVRRRWRSRPSAPNAPKHPVHPLKQLHNGSTLDGVLDISKEASDAIAMQEQQVEWTPFEIAFPPDSPASASGRSRSPAADSRKANPPVQTPTPGSPPTSPHPKRPSRSSVSRPLSLALPPPTAPPTAPLPDIPASGLAERRNFKGGHVLTSIPIVIPPMPRTPPPPQPSSTPHSLRRQPRFSDLNNAVASPMCRSRTFPLQRETQKKRDPVRTPPALSPEMWGPWRAVPGGGVRVSIGLPMGRQISQGSTATRRTLPLPLALTADGRQMSQDSARTTLAVPRVERQTSHDSAASTTPPGTPTPLVAFPLPPRATFTKRVVSVPNSAAREMFFPDAERGAAGQVDVAGAGVEPLVIVKRASAATVGENSVLASPRNSVPASPRAAVMDELFESLDDVYADYQSGEGAGEAASLVPISLSSDESARGVHPLGTSVDGGSSVASSILGDLDGTWRTTYSLADEYAVLFTVPAPPVTASGSPLQQQEARPCPYSLLAEKTQNLGTYHAIGSKSLPDFAVV